MMCCIPPHRFILASEWFLFFHGQTLPWKVRIELQIHFYIPAFSCSICIILPLIFDESIVYKKVWATNNFMISDFKIESKMWWLNVKTFVNKCLVIDLMEFNYTQHTCRSLPSIFTYQSACLIELLPNATNFPVECFWKSVHYCKNLL